MSNKSYRDLTREAKEDLDKALQCEKIPLNLLQAAKEKIDMIFAHAWLKKQNANTVERKEE